MHAPNTEHAPRVAAARGSHLHAPLQFEALTRWGVAEPLAGRGAHGLSCVDPAKLSGMQLWQEVASQSARTQHRACSSCGGRESQTIGTLRFSLKR